MRRLCQAHCPEGVTGVSGSPAPHIRPRTEENSENIVKSVHCKSERQALVSESSS